MQNTIIMFLGRNTKKKGGVGYECRTLVESVRTARGPRERIVATIGRLPGLDREERIGWDEIGRILSGKPPPMPGLFDQLEDPPSWATVNLSGVSVERLRHFGDVYLGLLLWKQLEFAEFCREQMPSGREEIPWSIMAVERSRDIVQRQLVVNQASVMTLWAAVVAEVLGVEHDEALTLGRAVAELNAYSNGVSLGLFQPTPKEVQEQRRKMRKEEIVTVDLSNRAVPAKHTDEELRALSGESPIHPESVQKYLEGKFGNALEDVSRAMLDLAKSLPPSQLAEKAFGLCEKFRPEIPPGKKGWGASGKLDLALIREMASS